MQFSEVSPNLRKFHFTSGPHMPEKLSGHTMISIDEGKALIIGGDNGNACKDSIYLLTCSNMQCNFSWTFSQLNLTLSRARSKFVAMSLPDDYHC